jgi:hypothetical protein
LFGQPLLEQEEAGACRARDPDDVGRWRGRVLRDWSATGSRAWPLNSASM